VKNLCMFLMLMMLAVFNLQAGTLSATTDRANLSARETLTLSIQYDETADDEPDTRELEQQFMILSRNKSSSIRIINGDASSTTTWYFELSPRKSGTLVIPSFTVNGDSSEAITIEVTTKPDTQASSSQNIYTEALLDKDNVYVQQQVIATWRLVSRFNISEPQFLPPKIDGALVQDLGIRGFHRPGADGSIERVIEQRYAIFPQQSGNIIIPPQQFQAVVDTPQRTASGFFRPSRSQVRLGTDEKSISVMPADTRASTDWLPASALEISQEITGTNQAQQATAGIAFTRVIRIRAEGLSAEQLPPADMQATGIKFYSENPVFSNKESPRGVIGLREDRAAIIATQAGKLTLPAITIPWYDVDASQWRESVLPETVIDVLPGASTAGSTQTERNTADAVSAPSGTMHSPVSATEQQNSDGTQTDSGMPNPWQISTALLLILVIAITGYWYRLYRRIQSPDQANSIASQPLAVVKPRRSAALLRTAEQGNLKDLHQELSAWAKELPANSAALHDPSVAPLLLALEKHLYGDGSAPDPNAIKELPAQLEKIARGYSNGTEEKNQLDTLYR
jgi:hypothetical protein